MLIRNYSETRPHALSRPGEYVYRLSQYGMYKVTQSSQQSLPGYSCPAGHGVFTVITPPGTTTFNAVLQCRICYIVPHTQSWGVELVTKNDEGVKWNRPILHWPLTHYCTACMFHAHFMHYTESDHQKLGGGPIHCWSPNQKVGGGLVSLGPHGCCAYVGKGRRSVLANKNLRLQPWWYHYAH